MHKDQLQSDVYRYCWLSLSHVIWINCTSVTDKPNIYLSVNEVIMKFTCFIYKIVQVIFSPCTCSFFFWHAPKTVTVAIIKIFMLIENDLQHSHEHFFVLTYILYWIHFTQPHLWCSAQKYIHHVLIYKILMHGLNWLVSSWRVFWPNL